MRRPLLLLGGVGVLAALHVAGSLAGGAPSSRSGRALRSVTVDIRCDGARLASSRVSPDPVTLAQGDQLDWVLADSSDVDAFDVAPAQIQGERPWPFPDSEGTRHGTRGAPARGRGMRARAAGRYEYAVTARCGAGSGGAGAEVSIDPILIIRAE